MYTVTDKPIAKIYSINSDGDLIDSLDFIGNDLEAIVFNKNDSTYWVSEESLIQIVKIDTEGKEVNRFDIDFLPNTFESVEIEGLSINYLEDSIYLLNGKNPGAIISLDIHSLNVNNIYYLNFANDYSGIHFNQATKNFAIVSDEDKKLFFWNSESGLEHSIELSYFKGEGITVVQDSLFIITEQENMLYKYLIYSE